jgi:hypothetical protein
MTYSIYTSSSRYRLSRAEPTVLDQEWIMHERAFSFHSRQAGHLIFPLSIQKFTIHENYLIQRQRITRLKNYPMG